MGWPGNGEPGILKGSTMGYDFIIALRPLQGSAQDRRSPMGHWEVTVTALRINFLNAEKIVASQFLYFGSKCGIVNRSPWQRGSVLDLMAAGES